MFYPQLCTYLTYVHCERMRAQIIHAINWVKQRQASGTRLNKIVKRILWTLYDAYRKTK